MSKYFLVPVSCTGRLNSYNMPFFEKYPQKMSIYNEIVRGSNENPALLGGIIVLDEHLLCFTEYDCKEDAELENICQVLHNASVICKDKNVSIPQYLADKESVEWLCKMNFSNWEVSDFV